MCDSGHALSGLSSDVDQQDRGDRDHQVAEAVKAGVGGGTREDESDRGTGQVGSDVLRSPEQTCRGAGGFGWSGAVDGQLVAESVEAVRYAEYRADQHKYGDRRTGVDTKGERGATGEESRGTDHEKEPWTM